MFTARMFGIEPETNEYKIFALQRLHSMHQELEQSSLSMKQVLLDDIERLQLHLQSKVPATLHELLCAARLDKANEKPLFTRAVLEGDARYTSKDIDLIFKANPEAAKLLELRRLTLAKL